MKITSIRSDSVYSKIMDASVEKKNDIYRYELMMPFEKKWDCYNIPLKASSPNDYDIIMASEMMGILTPTKVDEAQKSNIEQISSDTLWLACEQAIRKSLECFTESGINMPVQNYQYSILLAEPSNPYTILNKGYCGDGGIPGYIIAWLVPSQYTIDRLPVCFAHEVNHNIRFQFIQWKNNITLGEMLVSEGLAENFATSLYGENKAGPWITETDTETLNDYIKPIVYEGLDVQGLENLSAYLYGDEIAVLQNYPPVGLPYCAGYACGYYLIKHYLKKTGKSIVEATILPANEILEVVEDFWNIS